MYRREYLSALYIHECIPASNKSHKRVSTDFLKSSAQLSHDQIRQVR